VHAPFVAAANSPALLKAFDQLVGEGRWVPRVNLGTFPVRFPSAEDPGDAGWHIDPSFGTENPDFLSWRANVSSKARALQKFRRSAMREPCICVTHFSCTQPSRIVARGHVSWRSLPCFQQNP
jgi:hypothetical protein